LTKGPWQLTTSSTGHEVAKEIFFESNFRIISLIFNEIMAKMTHQCKYFLISYGLKI